MEKKENEKKAKRKKIFKKESCFINEVVSFIITFFLNYFIFFYEKQKI